MLEAVLLRRSVIAPVIPLVFMAQRPWQLARRGRRRLHTREEESDASQVPSLIADL